MDYEKLESNKRYAAKKTRIAAQQKNHKVRSIGQRKPDNEIRKAKDF